MGAVVSVTAGEGAAASPQPAAAKPQAASFVPAQAGTQSSKSPKAEQVVPASRVRGDERVESARPQSAAASSAPIALDPFFEVRTPERNYGSAKLPGGTFVTPLARRLASEAGIDLS